MSVTIERFEWDAHNVGHLAQAHPEYDLEFLAARRRERHIVGRCLSRARFWTRIWAYSPLFDHNSDFALHFSAQQAVL